MSLLTPAAASFYACRSEIMSRSYDRKQSACLQACSSAAADRAVSYSSAQACGLWKGCRVYYDASERPEEVWAEHSDGSCRWRQTGSEVKVIALKVVYPPSRCSSTLRDIRLLMRCFC